MQVISGASYLWCELSLVQGCSGAIWVAPQQLRCAHSLSGKPVGNRTDHTSVNDTIDAIANAINIIINDTNISNIISSRRRCIACITILIIVIIKLQSMAPLPISSPQLLYCCLPCSQHIEKFTIFGYHPCHSMTKPEKIATIRECIHN